MKPDSCDCIAHVTEELERRNEKGQSVAQLGVDDGNGYIATLHPKWYSEVEMGVTDKGEPSLEVGEKANCAPHCGFRQERATCPCRRAGGPTAAASSGPAPTINACWQRVPQSSAWPPFLIASEDETSPETPGSLPWRGQEESNSSGRGVSTHGRAPREKRELMKCRRLIPILMIAMLWVIPARSALVGQSSAPKGYVHACDLVSNTEVERVTGRHLTDDPGRLGTVQHTESACDFWKAETQVALISTPLPRKTVSRIMEGNGFDQTPHALSGVGDSASIYFSLKGKEPEGFLVAYVGPRTLTVRVKMKPGQPPESAQPYAVGLARIAAPRVR